MEQGTATAVNKEQFSFKRMFMKCIPFHDHKKDAPTDSMISAIKMEIRVNETKCCRKISVKGVYGDYGRLQEYVNSFRNKVYETVNLLSEQKKNMKERRRSSGNLSNVISTGAKHKK